MRRQPVFAHRHRAKHGAQRPVSGPRQLSGRRVAYLLKELDEWLESRPVSDLPSPVNCEFGSADHLNKAKPLTSD